MNAASVTRKPRLVMAALAAAATLAVGTKLVLSQEAPPARPDGPPAASPQQAPPGAMGRPGAEGPGRPGRGDFGRGPDGPGPAGPRGGRRGAGRGQGPGGPAMDMPRREAVQLSGTVANYNFGPRGTVEALMIKTGDKTVQVNLPPPLAPFAAQVAAVGGSVNLSAYPEMGLPDHPVYELSSIKNEQGREVKEPSPADRKFVHEESTVKTLNYARHGEVNGAILDNGDFVHLGPAARDVKLAVGQKITVDGVGHPMLMSDHKAVEAIAIDGKMLEPGDGPAARGGRQAGPERPRGGGPGGPRGPGRMGGRGGPEGPGGPDDLNGPGTPGGAPGGDGPRGARGRGTGPGVPPPPHPQGGGPGDSTSSSGTRQI